MILNKMLPEVYFHFKGIPSQWDQASPDAPATGASGRENKNDLQT